MNSSQREICYKNHIDYYQTENEQYLAPAIHILRRLVCDPFCVKHHMKAADNNNHFVQALQLLPISLHLWHLTTLINQVQQIRKVKYYALK